MYDINSLQGIALADADDDYGLTGIIISIISVMIFYIKANKTTGGGQQMQVTEVNGDGDHNDEGGDHGLHVDDIDVNKQMSTPGGKAPGVHVIQSHCVGTMMNASFEKH